MTGVHASELVGVEVSVVASPAGRRDQLAGLGRALRRAAPAPGVAVNELRSVFESHASAMDATPGVVGVPEMAGGVPAEWFLAQEPRRGTIMHLHGGGYVLGSSESLRPLAAGLVAATGSRVLAPNYRLAPEHPFPAALDDAVNAYRWLVHTGTDPADIVISGDSAGGGLAVATALALRERGLPLPAALICMSPWTDLTLSAGGSLVGNAELDPQVSAGFLAEAAAHYLGGHDPRDPLASPVFADLSGLPPMLIQVSQDEVLLDDARRLAAAAARFGVVVSLECWESMFHVWQAFGPRLPEAGAALDRIGSWMEIQNAQNRSAR